jgi:hypothetical protein
MTRLNALGPAGGLLFEQKLMDGRTDGQSGISWFTSYLA